MRPEQKKLYRAEQMPYDPIGVCMCDERRRKIESNKEMVL